MSKHKWMPASVLTILFAMQATGSNAEPRIGTAASTRPNAEAISGGEYTDAFGWQRDLREPDGSHRKPRHGRLGVC